MAGRRNALSHGGGRSQFQLTASSGTPNSNCECFASKDLLMLASLVIVFREVIEAGLIVGIVLAATRGVPRRGRWVAGGVLGGTLGACVVAAFAGELGSLFNGSGAELFNAAILLTAVGMLTWHNTWMASHGREMAREARALGTAVAAGDRPLTALAVVVGVAVLREGSEVVLFLYGIFAAGGTSIGDMAGGGALGIVLGAALSALIYLGLLAVPAHRLFAVTTGLITLLAAGLAAQAVFFLQQANYFQGMATPLWDTTWLLSEDSMTGRLLHTLVGYTATPDAAQLIAYGLVILVMLALMRVARGRTAAARHPAPLSP
jgi:high-affinity iron transporter